MNNEVIIKIQDVSMKYRLTTEKISSLKQYFIKTIKRQIKYEEFYALQDIDFEIKKGQKIGIIGLNGAGKSTVLKIVAGVLKPSRGEVHVNGQIAPLLELGAGFDAELTGRENIYLNGMILGYSKKYLNEHLNEIIEFSELGKFIDVPIKNYSSGMKARLGFSIATITQPDILIVDEALSVGDIKFRKKCENKINSMIGSGATVLFVSHSIEQVENLCDSVLWLESGKLKMSGDSKVVCKYYKENTK